MINRNSFLFGLLLVLSFYSCEYKDTAVAPPSPVALLPECEDAIITGYTNKISYFPGEEAEVFLQSAKHINCGLGLYNINGELVFRAKATPSPQTQSSAEPWRDGFGYKSSGKIIVPPWLKSGIYYIEKKITIVVKSMASTDVLVVYPSNTINAYNPVGGKSLYGFNSSEGMASTIVSFLRPMDSTIEKEECIECLKWFPSLSHLKIKYVVDMDLDNYSSFHSKIIMIVGHSEYWTRRARMNFDRFVNEGGNAIILSGNTMWWQVRYTSNNNGLICYRSSELDPEVDESLKTVQWRNQILQYPILPSIGEDFEGGGYGLHLDNGWNGYKIFNPSSPLLEGLSFKKGDILKLPSTECDGAPIKAWDADGFPILDNEQLQFAKLELIGFDFGSRGNKETVPTFTVMQKKTSSGIIVNVGTMDWCSIGGMGNQDSGDKIKVITRNAIDKLLNGKKVFSE
ncbi:MAG TPA: N,N-dimethylformamidase beta subunit family domain-containing protein [Cyclobacteriaceae bacterium]|jgi:hypothetical protein|nr:N,N-dimethylformamidase beta subunit family domain-containing protein [Cyclobacteriaceae bacterium]